MGLLEMKQNLHTHWAFGIFHRYFCILDIQEVQLNFGGDQP